MSTDTSQSALVDNLVAEFRESLSRRGLHDGTVRRYAQGARHFVVWHENDGALLADADDGLLQRFAGHSCECGFRGPQMARAYAASVGLRSGSVCAVPGSARSCSPSRRTGRGLPLGGSVRAIRVRPRLPAVHRRYVPAHVHSLRPLAAPVQDPVRPGRRRRGGAFCRSRLPVPGTTVASSSQAVPRPEGRSESCPFCRLPGRGRCPGRRTCAPAHAAGRAPRAVPAVVVAERSHFVAHAVRKARLPEEADDVGVGGELRRSQNPALAGQHLREDQFAGRRYHVEGYGVADDHEAIPQEGASLVPRQAGRCKWPVRSCSSGRPVLELPQISLDCSFRICARNSAASCSAEGPGGRDVEVRGCIVEKYHSGVLGWPQRVQGQDAGWSIKTGNAGGSCRR